MSELRTVVADDNKKMREFICRILRDKTQCLVVGEAEDGFQAVEQVKKLTPELILLDLALPKMNGIETAQRILEIFPALKIVFVSQNSTPEVVQEAFHLGASGYVLKSDAVELPAAIEAVSHGTQFVSRRLKRLWIGTEIA